MLIFLEEKTYEYYKNDCSKLKAIIRTILRKSFNTVFRDEKLEDLLSESHVIFAKALNDFNPNCGMSFDTYLYMCIERKICKIFRDEKAAKRIGAKQVASLNAENEEGEPAIFHIPCDYNLEEEVIGTGLLDTFEEVKVKYGKFFAGLSDRAAKVARMICDGMDRDQIINAVGIACYNAAIREMQRFENRRKVC